MATIGVVFLSNRVFMSFARLWAHEAEFSTETAPWSVMQNGTSHIGRSLCSAISLKGFIPTKVLSTSILFIAKCARSRWDSLHQSLWFRLILGFLFVFLTNSFIWSLMRSSDSLL